MDRVSIYEYDRKNRERVVKAIEEAGGQILSWSFFAKDQSKFELPPGTLSVFFDISSLFYNEDRADALIAPAELMLNIIQQEQFVALYVIIERQYSKQVRDLELATENEVVVEHRTVFYEILQVLSAPNTDGVDFFFRNDQTRQIIISMQFIPKSVAVVVDIFFHIANLHVSL